MSIEKYKHAEDNYIGYLSHTRMANVGSAFDEKHIPRSTASVVIGDETYYRCGALVASKGTRVDAVEFQDWVDKFGISYVLTEDELRDLIAANQPEEVE